MKIRRLTLAVVCMAAAVADTLACTNLIVGKSVSADGSTIIPIRPTPIRCSASCITTLLACTRRER